MFIVLYTVHHMLHTREAGEANTIKNMFCNSLIVLIAECATCAEYHGALRTQERQCATFCEQSLPYLGTAAVAVAVAVHTRNQCGSKHQE